MLAIGVRKMAQIHWCILLVHEAQAQLLSAE